MTAIVALDDQIIELGHTIVMMEDRMAALVARGANQKEEEMRIERLRSCLATLQWVKKNETTIREAISARTRNT